VKPYVFVAWLMGSVLSGVTSACAGLTPTEADLSTAFEPPRSWQAAIFFDFVDSTFVPDAADARRADYATTIEFHDGTRWRVVTARDQFDAPTGERRTPWYRLRPGRSGVPVAVRVFLDHAGGGRTTADYALTIQRGEFVNVLAMVYTRDPNEWYISMPRYRKAFPLHPSARASPGDSLWIMHAARGRECFGCPN
jgi:hypothetical protein